MTASARERWTTPRGRELLFLPPLFERITRRMLGPARSLYRAVLMTKAVTGGTVVPFHQDGAATRCTRKKRAPRQFVRLFEGPAASKPEDA